MRTRNNVTSTVGWPPPSPACYSLRRRWAMFKDVVSSKQELRALFGEPNERAVLKCKAALDEHSRAFIVASPFLLLATSNAAGQCDVSPKGDKPGFVLVLDETHLVVPDRPGNHRIDGLTNILEN